MKLIKKVKSRYSNKDEIKLNSPLMTRILAGLIFLIVLTLLNVNIRLITALIISIIFNSLLAGFQLKRGLPTDFELSTFSTVMVTMAFGLKWGILIAIFSKLIASIYTGNIIADHFFMIATYINAAIISFIFRSVDPLLLGLAIVMINCTLMFLISKNILGLDITSNMSYTSTNFIFNTLVFLTLARLVFSLLS